MRLTATENARLLAQLRSLDDEQWQAPTDCAGWTVRDVAVHLIASAQAQANPLEFVRQVLAGRRLTAQIGGQHWVDGLNEAQLRARTRLDPGDAAGPLGARTAAAALKARRRMPAPVRALPLLPIGTGLGVHIGWQPLALPVRHGLHPGRLDAPRSTSPGPPASRSELTPEHDGRIVADILAEWSRRHGQPYTLTLTGPGRRASSAPATGGEPQTVDAVEFARILSGRAEGPAILRHKLPL